MPRGNDAAAALADLRGEYAGSGGSAEDLIASARAAWSPTLRTANNIQRDLEYDEKLGKDVLVRVDLDKVQSKIGDAGVVLDAAKRGPYVVAVVETESGRTYKEALPAESVGFDKARNRPSLPSPEEGNPEADALHERMSLSVEAKQIEAEAEEAAAEARRKVLEKHQEKVGEQPKPSGSGSGSSSGSGSGGSKS